MLITGIVKVVHSNGIGIKFWDFFEGTIDSANLLSKTSDKKSFKKDQIV